MPQNHYAIGGTMAVYSVIGRMKVYEVTGKPFGNDFVPRHREGSGSITGVGSLTADYIFGGVGGIVGNGSPAASAMSVRSGDSSIVGAGSPVAYGGKSNSFDGTIVGVGDPQASGTEGEAFYSAELGSVGSLAASGTTTRNSVAVTATGDGSPAASGSAKQNFYEMIVAESATANLDFCLDAAETDSYPGTGQTWTDLTGNGNNFYRGTNVTAETYDPTFNGTAGDLSSSEFFSSDGNDIFRGTAAHAFPTPWHKNNGVFTLAGIGYRSGTTAWMFFASYISSSPHLRVGFGTNAAFNPGNKLFLTVLNSSGGVSSQHEATDADIPDNEFFFWAVASDESVGTDGLTLQINATREKKDSTYSSPSTGTVTTIQLGVLIPNGARLATMAGWSRRLSDAELDAIYARLKLRFTSLP